MSGVTASWMSLWFEISTDSTILELMLYASKYGPIHIIEEIVTGEVFDNS